MTRSFGFVVYAAVSFAALTYLLVFHMIHVAKLTNLALAYTLMWVHLALKMFASLAARPHTVRAEVDIDGLDVDIVVPVFNEDPELLAAGIRSFARQTRPPRGVWLTDDGSHPPAGHASVLDVAVVRDALEEVHAAGIEVDAARKHNGGKREAQARAFKRSDADIFVTVDSDTILRHDCLEKLLVPFSRRDTMSVAGTAYGQNYRRSILTRAIEVGFVMTFIQGRMAEGAFGAVRVNCGILAAYRGDVVRENLDRYLGQRFLGRPVRSGDDRCLTIFSKERGRSEYVVDAIAYSALPETFSHLIRQRLRWARSWCWGTLWLLRRPLLSADFLFTITQLTGLLMYVIALPVVLAGTVLGAISPELVLSTVGVSMAIGMVSHFRYVVLRRDAPLASRLLTWALSPVASGLYMFVLLPLQYIAIASPRPRRTWGTRRQVEVGLDLRATATAQVGSVR